MKRVLRLAIAVLVLTEVGVFAMPPAAPQTPAALAQPPGLDHFLCYNVPTLSPLAEGVPFQLTPPVVTLEDQFARTQVQPSLPDRACNPVNKILPNGQAFPPQNPNAHLVCDPIAPQNPKSFRVRVENQFGRGWLTAAPSTRLCLPSWKLDVQNPNAPGSVPVPVPAGTPTQPPGLDHFQCYDVHYTGTSARQFTGKPPFVTLVDQFGTRQVTVGNPVELCNPVKKTLPNGQVTPITNPRAHLVCFEISAANERVVRFQNQFGTAQALVTQAVRLCLPSFKLRNPPRIDFDGDGDSDISIFRPSTAQFFVRGGSPEVTQYGVDSDVAVPADYNGDGSVDKAIYRPSTGQWYIRNADPVPEVTPYGAACPSSCGLGTDIPVPGDYDGDGDDDIAVFRPSAGQWFVRGGAPEVIQYGAVCGDPCVSPTDIPAPGDYDGDGDVDMAIYRTTTGQWFVRGGPEGVPYGAAGDIPAPGDYDGDGADDIAVFRPSTGQWFVRGGAPEIIQYGAGGACCDDIPVPVDYDGDGDADIAVYRVSTGQWFVRGGAPEVTPYGGAGDIPLGLPYALRLMTGLPV